MAEERRLFYVGITRAEDRVYLSHAFRRTCLGHDRKPARPPASSWTFPKN